MTKIKITVVKQFGPEDVLGHEFIRSDGTHIKKYEMTEEENLL